MHRIYPLSLIVICLGLVFAAIIFLVRPPNLSVAHAAPRTSPQKLFLPIVANNAGCSGNSLIQDGGFEASTSGTLNPYWQFTTNISRTIFDNSSIPMPQPTHSGLWKVWLGGDNSLQQTLTQTISIPPSATGLQVSTWWLINTTEPMPSGFDHMEMEILNSSGVLQEILYHFKDVDQGTAWAQRVVTATQAYAGQTIQLAFVASTDNTYPTSFFIDDVSVTCK